MGFDDLFNKSKKLFEDGKEKVTDFVESEKGEQLIDKSKKVFEDGKGKVTEFFDSDKGEQASDQVLDGASDVAKKVTPDAHDATVDDLRNKADGAVGNEK